MNKKFKSCLAMAMGFVMSLGFVGCGDNKPTSTGNDDISYDDLTIPVADYKKGTYRSLTATMPSNWNEFTYADNNDTQILSYISSSFFDYDYKFENDEKYLADGKINADAIVSGAYTTHYSAATKLEDVTSSVEAKWGYTDAQKKEGGYAWKITLRDDLKWDDGSEIHAADFEYSMKEILNPDFLNMRANTYYDTLRIKKSKAYFNKHQDATYPTIGSMGYKSNAEAIEAGEDIKVNVWEFWGAEGYVDEKGNACPQWVSYKDETVYNSVAAWNDPFNEEIQDAFSAKDLWDYYFAAGAAYAGYVEVGAAYETWLAIEVANTEKDITWDEVGFYTVDENSFVICLDKAYAFLTDNGSLSYLSAYYMSSLPLVKEDLYESCKQAPAEGATLWTSNYNSSLETTASWGPYKLTSFQSGKSYKLERNEHWYGYGMNLYANQYNVTAIECEKVDEPNTQWMKFLNGEVDEGGLSDLNMGEYYHSKYVTWVPGTGTFGMQLYGNLETLKASGNNNGILAIDEFRQAFSLALNRNDIVDTIWPGSSVACLGLMNNMYFYDVENSSKLETGGIYRNTKEAQEGLLRAYGYIHNEKDDTWSDGTNSGMSLEEAYYGLSGYNPTLAKETLKKAIEILEGDAEKYGYDPSKNITIVYGSSVDNAKQRERMDYLQKVLNELSKGTKLEGKITLKFDASAGSKWADAFRNGDTQIGFGYGFSGNAFNPFDIVGSFVDPDDSLNYHTYWDTTKEYLELTMPKGDYEGAGKTYKMSLVNWFDCLNGLAAERGDTYKFNWDAGYAPAEVRLKILSALEEATLKKSYSVMLIGEYSGSFLGAKFTNISEEYNTFMGFGGIRYFTVNYTDAEWTAFVKSNNNDLSNLYKQTSDAE